MHGIVSIWNPPPKQDVMWAFFRFITEPVVIGDRGVCLLKMNLPPLISHRERPIHSRQRYCWLSSGPPAICWTPVHNLVFLQVSLSTVPRWGGSPFLTDPLIFAACFSLFPKNLNCRFSDPFVFINCECYTKTWPFKRDCPDNTLPLDGGVSSEPGHMALTLLHRH